MNAMNEFLLMRQMLQKVRLTLRLLDVQNQVQGRFGINRLLVFPLTLAEHNALQLRAARTLFRYDPGRQQYTSYMEYDAYGGPVKRVDVTGRDHMGVPTPHVLDYSVRTMGSFRQYIPPARNRVRPALDWELPF